MPFPFYNTASPTPSTKNNITDIAVTYGIRDFLLHKNLLPTYPFISTAVNGSPKIGEPVLDTSINSNANTTPFGLPLETEGLVRYNSAISTNTFKNTDPSAPVLSMIDNVLTTQSIFGNVEFPQGSTSYPTAPNQEITDFGILSKSNYADFRKKATLVNLYLDTDKQFDAADWINLQPVGFSKQIKGYLDTYGHLNLGDGGGIEAANIIGSVLNGQGLGLSSGGVVPNFDLRSSLAGRILGATGLINDTRLGLIGGQQLALALANNAAFNVEQQLLGVLNVQDNVLSLVKNGTLAGFRPNYQITVPSSTFGKVADYTSRILGFTLPKSYLDDSGSIFLSESNSGNIERANSMILNTGNGQLSALIKNVSSNLIGTGQYDNPDSTPFRSGYVPRYKNHKGQAAINPNLYAFYNSDKATILHLLVSSNSNNGVIPEISYNRDKMIKNYGFISPEDTFTGPFGNPGYGNRKVSDVGFTWTTGNGAAVNVSNDFSELPLIEKKSLLVKTQLLFNSVGMKTIVSTKGDMNHSSSQIETANGNGISKGSAVIRGDRYTDDGLYDGKSNQSADNTYCRSWTTLDRYDNVSKLIRNSGLTQTSSNVPYRFNTNNSTLEKFGFPKIAPYTTDSFTAGNPKNYMFSIENLAWADNWHDLLPCETGRGDLLTGKRGRIMWFPPYNIQFTENASVNWETNNFIGRGESVYTYNNTERSGNLSFSIIVDHSSYINSFRGSKGPDDNYVASFFAGCIDPTSKFGDKLTISEMSTLATSNVQKPQQKVVTPQVPPTDFEVFFPNDVDVIPTDYENGLSGSSITDVIDYSTNPSGEGFGLGIYPGSFTSSGPWPDRTNFGLNFKGPEGKIIKVGDTDVYGFLDPTLIPALQDYLDTKCTACVVEVSGYASAQGKAGINQKLADARANAIINTLRNQLFTSLSATDKAKRFKKMPSKELTGTGCNPATGSDTDTLACKKDRKAVVHFRFDETLLPKEQTNPEPTTQTVQQNINTKITNRLYTECNYFEQLTATDNFVFDRFRDKIKYFHPAFHSTTPEGLNSRLTFLHQCTRQGPTLEGQGANNLAFGRPPVCVLRIGDFYNTKIIIDNITIDYEPIVWDLNPEGIGVQPMIANINMSFKFIGGSTLMGPINKLQNALSFNYYANTQVYDPRADYIAKTDQTNNKPSTKVQNGETTVTALSPYHLVNGVKNINSLIETIVTTEQIDANKPVLDQVAANDSATSGQGPDNSTSGGTPTITGFKIIGVSATQVYFYLSQKNIYDDSYNLLISESDFKNYMDKGIKIVFESASNATTSVRVEEVITGNNLTLPNNKKNPFTGYYMGKLSSGNNDYNSNYTLDTSLNDGSYFITVYYNGNKISTDSISLKDSHYFINKG